jgi:hypothetical protein
MTEHCTYWLQVVLILLVGGSTNNGLSVLNCHDLHEKFLIKFNIFIKNSKTNL